MKVTFRILCILLLSLLVASIEAPLEAGAGSVMSYLQSLEEEGKERVVVEFYGNVEPSLIEEYGGTVIRSFKTINGLLCEIPKDKILLLKRDERVKEVAPDILIELELGEDRRPEPEDQAMMLSLKEEYLRRIKEEYDALMEEVQTEYRKAYMDYYYRVVPYLRSYNRFMRWYQTLSNVRLKDLIYRRLIIRYRAIINQLEASFKEAYQRFKDRINSVEEAYVRASGEEAWRKELSEIRLFNYPGPVTVRWNNLEAGLNSKAAWDRYNLSGQGVKIAFLDSGVNYTLPDLKDNYLGGIDYVDDDDDPISTDPDEWHGTEVVSLACAKGISKVVGVSYNVGYYAIRIADESFKAFVSDAVSGVEWSSEEPHKADIISISAGVYGDEPGSDYWVPKLEVACNAAYEAGIVLVAGAGNDSYNYSAYPAAFENVISVGMYAENQVIPVSSNGGVDVVAPGWRVPVIDPSNVRWVNSGTSMATPHVSGLIALQLEYARTNNIDYNNGYHWEVMKHAAVDLNVSEPWQGKGKAWAAGSGQGFALKLNFGTGILESRLSQQSGYGKEFSIPKWEKLLEKENVSWLYNASDSLNLGSIDLMAAGWPILYTFEYPKSFVYDEMPAYLVGQTLYQDTLLTNITDILGNETHIIEELDATTIQRYADTGGNLPGDSEEDFEDFLYEPITIDTYFYFALRDDYFIPRETRPGTYNTELDLKFKLEGIDRLLTIKDKNATTWCAPDYIPRYKYYTNK